MIPTVQSPPGTHYSQDATMPSRTSPATTSSSNDWMGSPVSSAKPPNTFRLAYNNINSLGSTQYSFSIQQLAATQATLDVDYFGMTEHCLNIGQPRVRSTLTKSLNRDYLGQHVLQIDSANMQTLSPYLPGGTGILLVGPIIGRVAPNGKGGDPMGRWSFVSLRRQGKCPLAIYTVYKVNERPTNEVGITAWHQQRLQLDSDNRHNEHPREAFTQDLIKSVLSHQAQVTTLFLAEISMIRYFAHDPNFLSWQMQQI